MKKIILILLLVTLSSIFIGCGSDKQSINVFNYGRYIDPQVLEIFEDETGVKVNYTNYETNEEMYQKVKAGGSKYDVIFPSEYMVERMARENLLLEIDHSKLTNLVHVDKNFLDFPFDPENKYSMPYFWGTLGILYDKSVVDEPIDSWDILWNKKYENNILMQDSMRDAFAVSLKSLGYSLNSTNDNELEEAKQKLIDQKPLVLAYVVDQALDKMIGGEAALAVIYSGEAYEAMDSNATLDFAIPADGSNIWVDNMCIPSTSESKDLAEKFIDFMLRPEIAVMNATYVGYPTTNETAYSMVPDDMKDHPALYPNQDTLPELEFLQDLGDYNQVYDEMWTEIKSY